MFLAVVNESNLISADEVERAIKACATQLKMHVAPVWDMIPALIVFFKDRHQVPDSADVLTIFDDSDQAGFLGYHRVMPEGKPYSRVFVNPILRHGGELLTTSLSVSTVLSHEICEWFIDPFLNLWADGPEGQYALEICDPVDEDSYEIDGISVSNFVYRRFFDTWAPSICQFDHLRRITAPFITGPRGHMHVRKEGKLHFIRGRLVPDWKISLMEAPASRYNRRLQHHG